MSDSLHRIARWLSWSIAKFSEPEKIRRSQTRGISHEKNCHSRYFANRNNRFGYCPDRCAKLQSLPRKTGKRNKANRRSDDGQFHRPLHALERLKSKRAKSQQRPRREKQTPWFASRRIGKGLVLGHGWRGACGPSDYQEAVSIQNHPVLSGFCPSTDQTTRGSLRGASFFGKSQTGRFCAMIAPRGNQMRGSNVKHQSGKIAGRCQIAQIP